MRSKSLLQGVIACLPVVLPAVGLSHARELTFEERVRAQVAIERVYYSHQIGPQSHSSTQFHAMSSKERLTPTLRNLRRSVSAGTPRHRGHAANDPWLIRECLARPALVDRMIRGHFASDERIHAIARKESGDVPDTQQGAVVFASGRPRLLSDRRRLHRTLILPA